MGYKKTSRTHTRTHTYTHIHTNTYILTCTPQRVLQKYAQALLDRLPRTAGGAAVSSVTYPCVGTDWYVRMPKTEEQVRLASDTDCATLGILMYCNGCCFILERYPWPACVAAAICGCVCLMHTYS